MRSKKTFIFVSLIWFVLCGLSYAFSGDLCFEEAGKLHGINPALLKSIARVESGLNPSAISTNKNGSEDLGIMQINTAWIRSLKLCRQSLLTDACYNIKTGAKILRDCIDRWDYTWEAVGCYNAVSKPKKVNYSWKIYRQLMKERDRNVKMGLTKEDGILNFRVRDISSLDVEEKTEDSSLSADIH